MKSEPEIVKAVNQRSSFAGLLRIGGAMVVIAAMCAHLLEGWDHWNDVSRYYAMLGGTAILSFAGFAMSYLLKENKSARVFFGLGLLSVVANITTLGGLLHSAFPWDTALPQDIAWTDWTLSEGASLAALLGSAIAVLLPLAWFSYKIFVRDHAFGLLMCFAVTTGLILLPIRESLSVGLLIAVALAVPVLYWRNTAKGNVEFATPEGRFALAALFAPAIIMLARLLWLYEADNVLMWMLAAIALVGNRYLGHLLSHHSVWRHASSLVYIAITMVFGGLSITLLESHLPDVTLIPLFGVITGGLIWDKGRDYARQVFSILGFGWTLLVCTLNLLGYDSITASLIAAGVGLIVAILAHRERNVVITATALATMAIALLPRAWDLLELIDFTHWGTLSVIGIAAIVAGAAVERLKTRDS